MTQKSIILYVEDNFDNRNLIRRVLEAEGYGMVEASNAEEAMQRIISDQPDLILMDINMPGSGWLHPDRPDQGDPGICPRADRGSYGERDAR